MADVFVGLEGLKLDLKDTEPVKHTCLSPGSSTRELFYPWSNDLVLGPKVKLFTFSACCVFGIRSEDGGWTPKMLRLLTFHQRLFSQRHLLRWPPGYRLWFFCQQKKKGKWDLTESDISWPKKKRLMGIVCSIVALGLADFSCSLDTLMQQSSVCELHCVVAQLSTS